MDSLVFGDTSAASDIFALKDRLHGVFSRYGEVSRLDLVRADQGPSPRVMCFLRMHTPQQEQALVEALGMGRFGGDLVMVLALEAATEPEPVWALATRAAGPSSWR